MELNRNDKYKVNNLKYNLGQYVIPNDAKGGIAVDIGANNGCYIDQYKDFFSNIYAYEANFFLCERLNEKFKNIDNVYIFNNAVSNEDDKVLKLLAHKYSDDNGSSAIQKNIKHQDWEEFICEVNSISLESIIKKYGFIDHMKIDCETSEYEFLFNKDLKNIKYISLELHNQLGIDRYTELYNWITKTHAANQNVNYTYGQHQEILFTIK
jgi:FkbM family methyltransferase